jgi:hypothetical protein
MKKFLTIVGLLTIVATPLTIVATPASAQSIGVAQATVPEPSKAAAKESGRKIIVSGGDNMGTYIEAVEANFGKPNVTVTLPTMNAGEK